MKIKNKIVSALYAVAVTVIGTGCATSGPQKQVYEGFLDSNAQDFAVRKEALQNSGKVVKATFVKGPDGKEVAIYGWRDKTFAERANEHLSDNEAIYKNLERAAALGLGTLNTVNGFRTVNALQDINSTNQRQNSLLQTQNGLLQGMGNVLNSCR